MLDFFTGVLSLELFSPPNNTEINPFDIMINEFYYVNKKFLYFICMLCTY